MQEYQAIYDAVRSRIGNADIGGAVQSAVRDMNLGHCALMAQAALQEACAAQMRPSVLYRPTLTQDGDQWCALYGANLQDGVAGFGASPALAMYDFDRSWTACLNAAKGGAR